MTRRLVLDLISTAPVWRVPGSVVAAVRASAPADWEVVVVSAETSSDGDGGRPPSAEVLAALPTAEAYWGWGFSEALAAAAPQVRWVHSASAGVAGPVRALAPRPEVALTNAAGLYAEPMAEYALAGVLHFLRGFDVAVRTQREARWDKTPFDGETSPLREVAELRVLVVGAGGIGSAVARRFTALGATVTGVRRRPELGVPAGCARVVGPDALDAELPTADVVALTAPLTGGTVGLLDAARLAALPPGAIVVNVGRGALVDEGALAAALASGRLRGAVLDVFAREPLAPDSPLWHLPTALLTPHVSAVSARYWPRAQALFLDNWTRYRAGAPLANRVDRDAGY